MDRDSAEWWELAATGVLAVQRCDACGLTRFPARAFCAACRTEGWSWAPLAPMGVVESWIVSRWRAPEPFTVVRVRPAEARGCVMYGTWRGEREPRQGERVVAVFTERPSIEWRPEDADGHAT
ncbi:Zn-ribbon domain-containing OB-fold protein [Nonomuraea dietziae]|uniref:Zn-ribbon domain-containing OB-fold protein n=1 Tax=Nonomuraea dietziae TaxID=65515 RepID=UPI00342BA79C